MSEMVDVFTDTRQADREVTRLLQTTQYVMNQPEVNGGDFTAIMAMKINVTPEATRLM